MTTQLTVRPAMFVDVEQISALIHRVLRQFNADAAGEVAEWLLRSTAPSSIADCLGDARFNCLVAMMADGLAGVVTIRDQRHVHHFFVDGAHHRRGVGTALWQRAKSDAIAVGHCEEFVVRSSEFAVPVYERFGFSVAGERLEKGGVTFVPMVLVMS